MTPKPTKELEPLKPGLYEVPDIEIFTVGDHRADGTTWTVQDLNKIAENFQKYQSGDHKYFSPPVVIGHEEVQPLGDSFTDPKNPEMENNLKNTGVPKFGGIYSVRVDKGQKGLPTLFGTAVDVPAPIAAILFGKAYDRVSAEIYKEPPPGVPGNGPMLRRVSFLGGELPQVKTLADLPMPSYQGHIEKLKRSSLIKLSAVEDHGSYWTVYSEVIERGNTMPDLMAPPENKPSEDITNKLKERGFDTSVFDGMDDEQKLKFYRALDNFQWTYKEAGEGKDDEETFTEEDKKKAEEEAKKKEEDDKKVAEMSEHFNKFMDEGKEKFGDLFIKHVQDKMAEMSKPEDPKHESKETPEEEEKEHPSPSASQPTAKIVGNTEGNSMVQYNEKQLKTLVAEAVSKTISEKFSETSSKLDQKEKQLDAKIKAFDARERQKSIDAFCETMVQQGRMTPADCDTKNPMSKKSRLLRADPSTVVVKLSEKDKEERQLTELDLQMEEIRKSPIVVKYSEVVKGVAPAGSLNGDDADKAYWEEKASSFYDQFSESFTALGTDKKEFVETVLNEKDPENRKMLLNV